MGTGSADSIPFLVSDFDVAKDDEAYDFAEAKEQNRCTSCGICAKVCPPQCIWIVRSSDPETGKPVTKPAEFFVDTDICMNCHNTVGQDKEWVLVLKQYWERGEPIPWVKVHDLPDFVVASPDCHLQSGSAAIDGGGAEGESVYETLTSSARGQHEIGG